MPFTVTKRPTDPSSLGQSRLLPVGAAVPSLMQLSALISAITAPQTIISEGIPTVSKLAIKKKKKRKSTVAYAELQEESELKLER